MPLVYFDTNVYDRLGEGSIPAQEEQALRAALRRGNFTVRLGLADLDELVGQWDTDRVATITELKIARELVGFHDMLKQPNDLLYEAIEAYATGASPPSIALPEKERRLVVGRLSDVIGGSHRYDRALSDTVVGVRALKEESFKVWSEACEQARRELRSSYTSTQLRALNFNEYFLGLAPDFALAFAEHRGVAETCLARGIDGLLAIRTVRMAVGVALSLAFSLLAGGSGQPHRPEPRRSDGYDIWHAILSSVADVFLTYDERLAKHAFRVCLEGFQVVTSVGDLLDALALM